MDTACVRCQGTTFNALSECNSDECILFRLVSAKNDAEAALYATTTKFNAEKAARIAVIQSELMTEYGPALTAEQAAFKLADAAVSAEHLRRRTIADQERIDRAAAKLPFPVGSILCQWQYIYRHSQTTTKKVALTGVKAKLEIVTAGTVHPANMRWSKASIGDVILRTLKTDGTPGAKYESWWHANNGGNVPMWQPVGVDLNAMLCAAEIAAEQKKLDGAKAELEAARLAAVNVFGLAK